MVTTIQLNEDVKRELDCMKTRKETYEDVIVNLIRRVEKNKTEQDKLLIEGCNAMTKDMVNFNKEWESVNADIGWEW